MLSSMLQIINIFKAFPPCPQDPVVKSLLGNNLLNTF